MMREWVDIDCEQLKKKIYQRVYYLQSKRDSIEKNCSSQKNHPKPQLFKSKLLEKLLLLSCFVFLLSESRKFYIYFRFDELSAFILPLLVEVLIFSMALRRGVAPKILVILLFLFNTLSFSFYSVLDYQFKAQEIENSKLNINNLKNSKLKLDQEYKKLAEDLGVQREIYNQAIKNRFISKANKNYQPLIKSLSKRMSKNRLEIRDINHKLAQNQNLSSVEVVLAGTIVQNLKSWVPSAPKLSKNESSEVLEQTEHVDDTNVLQMPGLIPVENESNEVLLEDKPAEVVNLLEYNADKKAS